VGASGSARVSGKLGGCIMGDDGVGTEGKEVVVCIYIWRVRGGECERAMCLGEVIFT